MVPNVLRTVRLDLSAPEEGDEQAIFEACQDPEIARFIPLPHPYERKHAVRFIEYAAAAWEAGNELTWAIRSGGVLTGMTSLRVNEDEAEIGYWLAAHARHRGYAAEAVRAVVDFGFAAEGLDLARIAWRAAVGNLASARVAEGLGFRLEGILRQGIRLGSGRQDCWIAALLARDERGPAEWPIRD
ncbi:GNAT family N-acetyltransferase [Sinomonas terrae]|uniref:GNAT family N-acetyltransferase n=1 Tax=Sinomonas terrae TaxID=2908838 RepID=A0ABS9U0C4_9MICC|nr:GNAT family N-acetyltransferase [Sinomonas terrae]MCH6470128.1 GNAT family N-acetyltransferase [Sinomonas terrae]